MELERKRCLRDMLMVKALFGGIKSTNRCVVVVKPLGCRTRNAAPRQVVNFLLQAVPSKTFHDEANGGFGVFFGVSKIILRG